MIEISRLSGNLITKTPLIEDTSSPSHWLERKLLEARIDATMKAFNLVPFNKELSDLVIELRAQLKELEGGE